MNEKDILQFRTSLQDFTLDELETKAEELKKEIGKMVLNMDLITKAAIVDTLIKEKKGE